MGGIPAKFDPAARESQLPEIIRKIPALPGQVAIGGREGKCGSSVPVAECVSLIKGYAIKDRFEARQWIRNSMEGWANF